MPLKVMTQPLGFPEPVVRVAEPMYLFAETCNLLDVTGLLVYRSVLVEDDDPIYADVADLLRRSRVEVLVQAVIEDDMMMMGQGEWSCYLLHSARPPLEQVRDPRVLDVITIADALKDPVHPLFLPGVIKSRVELARAS